MIQIPFLSQGLGIALALAVAVAGTQTVRLASVRTDLETERANHADTKTRHAEELGKIDRLTSHALELALRERDARAAADAATDLKHSKELTRALSENDRLAAAVAAGQRLRIAGTCKPTTAPAGGGQHVPTTEPAGSVGDGTIELSATAGRTYIALRAEVIRDREKLAYLQAKCNPTTTEPQP